MSDCWLLRRLQAIEGATLLRTGPAVISCFSTVSSSLLISCLNNRGRTTWVSVETIGKHYSNDLYYRRDPLPSAELKCAGNE